MAAGRSLLPQPRAPHRQSGCFSLVDARLVEQQGVLGRAAGGGIAAQWACRWSFQALEKKGISHLEEKELKERNKRIQEDNRLELQKVGRPGPPSFSPEGSQAGLPWLTSRGT